MADSRESSAEGANGVDNRPEDPAHARDGALISRGIAGRHPAFAETEDGALWKQQAGWARVPNEFSGSRTGINPAHHNCAKPPGSSRVRRRWDWRHAVG